MTVSATLKYRLWKMTDFSAAGFLGDIPVQGVSFGNEVNGAGSFSGKINLSDPGAAGVVPLLTPGAVALFVDLNGTLAWGGPVWTKRYKRSTRELQVGGSEFWSYFSSRVQAADYTNTWLSTSADPQSIVRQVVADALAVTGSPPLTVTASAASSSSFWVTVSYPIAVLQTVASIVSTLAGQGYQAGGFDWTVGLAYSGGQPAAQVTFSYPRAGRTYGVGGWFGAVDVSSDTCLDFEYLEDATGQGTKVYEAAMGGSGFQASAGGVLTGWPLLEQVKSHTGLSVPSNNLLSQQATSDLAVARYPLVTPMITTNTTVFGPGIAGVGDDVRVICPPGDPGFPAGFDQLFRVQRMDTTVPDDAGIVSTVSTLNMPPAASPQRPPL